MEEEEGQVEEQQQQQQPPKKKRRLPFTNKQRQELRKYHADHPELYASTLSQWFETQYGRYISQSSISEILSTKYSYLDGAQLKPLEENAHRATPAAYPLLEEALFQVHQLLIQDQQQTTSTVLKKAARRLWRGIPAFRGLQEPGWSNGWLEGFLRRREIPRKRQQLQFQQPEARNEPGALEHEVQLQNELVRTELQPHDLARDTYNLCESALFWKLTPESSLSIDRLRGHRNELAKFTLIHCWNADGSHVLPLWVVGKAESPPSFGPNMRNISKIDVTYRSNLLAGITAPLMSEWLLCFAQATRGRSIILSLDSHSAHEIAVTQLAQMPQLAHIRIIHTSPEANSLPASHATGRSLMRAFKAAYRRRSLEYMVDQAQLGEGANIDHLKAVRWAATAWTCITPSFIAGTWQQPSVLSSPHAMHSSKYCYEAKLTEKLVQLNVIKQAIDIEIFMDPPDEVVDDTSASDPVQYVIDLYQSSKDDKQEEETLAEPPFTSPDDASRAIERLLQYEQQQGGNDPEIIQQLEQYQRLMFTQQLQVAEGME